MANAAQYLNKPLVLVTGATGYIGSHVVGQLIQEGYPVRVSIRPGRSNVITQTWPQAVKNRQLQTVEVEDLASSDLTAAFEGGVSVLVHVAAAVFATGATNKEISDAAIQGTANVVEFAIKAGVKKIIATGTFAALFDHSDFSAAFGTKVITEDSWGNIASVDEIDIDKETDMAVYMASKGLAEKKFWEIADANPDVDFTTILPAEVWGNFLPTYPLPPLAQRSALSTLVNVYSLLADGPDSYPNDDIGHIVHVKDVARAHVLAITAPPYVKNGQRLRKRCILSGDICTYQQVAEYVRQTYPELAGRLPRKDLPPPKQTSAPLSRKVVEEALGLKEYCSRKTIIDDSIETLRRFDPSLESAKV